MSPIAKWALIGAALAVVQYLIFNGAHQQGATDRFGFGVLAIIFYSAIGAIIGLIIKMMKK